VLAEVDTDICGVTFILLGLAWVNIQDARRDPQIRAELVRRCTAPAGQGWKYTPDLPRQDRWSTVVPLLRRTPAKAPVRADCEDQTAAYATAIFLLEPQRVVEVSVTQPEPGKMAHAYLWVDEEVFDPSVLNGMRAPPPGFYGSGETSRIRLVDPMFLVNRVR
jgi:hypothetical protein